MSDTLNFFFLYVGIGFVFFKKKRTFVRILTYNDYKL